jgi:hypothetical protein
MMPSGRKCNCLLFNRVYGSRNQDSAAARPFVGFRGRNRMPPNGDIPKFLVFTCERF